MDRAPAKRCTWKCMKSSSLLLLLVTSRFPACGGTGNSRLVVGSKNFTEQTVLAELLAQHLGSKLAIEVDRRVNLGER